MLPSQQVEHRRQRLARLQQERDDALPAVAVPVVEPAPARAPEPRARSTPRRTVSTLAGEKTCWICYETSSENPARKFVHACDCTLLAHSDCLLEWLSVRPQSRPECPVCATRIVVRERRSSALVLYRHAVQKLDRLSVVATVGGLAASAWFVASAYGMWALRVFVGDRVANALIDHAAESGRFPFRLWLNLPLIPFALILSRTPLIDSLLPFLPLTLALSTHSHGGKRGDPLGLADLTLAYPPSPTLTVCVLPWLRIAYFRLRDRVYQLVLGDAYLRTNRHRLRGLAGMMDHAARDEQATREVLDPAATASHDDADGDGDGEAHRARARQLGDGIELVAELEYEFDDEDEEDDNDNDDEGEREREQAAATATATARPTHPRRRRRRAGATTRTDTDTDADARADPDPPSSVRIGIGRLTSLLIGALMYPALASAVGSCLFYLATKTTTTRGGGRSPSLAIKTLRKILGISSLIASSSSSSLPSRPESIASALGYLNPFSTSLRPRGGGGAPVVDPVWIRNTIGGGIVLVVRDAVVLAVDVLEQRRKASRTVVERPVGDNLSF
ncbi:hypothetical protein JCM11491_004441 [Sporobolomyces phaffii]